MSLNLSVHISEMNYLPYFLLRSHEITNENLRKFFSKHEEACENRDDACFYICIYLFGSRKVRGQLSPSAMWVSEITRKLLGLVANAFPSEPSCCLSTISLHRSDCVGTWVFPASASLVLGYRCAPLYMA